MNELTKKYYEISSAISNEYYVDLGLVDFHEENDDMSLLKINVLPHEGIHKGKQYCITLKFQDDNEWPSIFIDSEIFDKIKTNQYLNNQGTTGAHKGICIKNFCYAYPFKKNFKERCGEQWKNYLYNIIVVFNNLQDFDGGNGFKSNYKKILSL
jgi:hypothetical protein